MRRALVIGSGIFRDPRLPPLPAVERDVAALAEVLSDPLRGGYAVSRRFNVAAARLRSEIETLFADAARDDDILIFISGHGYLDSDGQLFFATHDTDLDLLLSTSVEARMLATLMKRSPAASVIVLLDCCHSGAFGFKSSIAVSPATFPVGRGRTVLTATTAMQLAWEGKRVSIGSGLSVFTHHVVHGIRTGTADIDGDGQVTIRDLFDYVQTKMAGHQDLQAPTLIVDQLEAYPVIARTCRHAAPPTSQPAAAQALPSPSRLAPARVTLRHPLPMEFIPFAGDAVARGHVSRTTVTASQFATYLSQTSRSKVLSNDATAVATNVSWFLAQGFCDWLSEEARLTATLPTEQEFAAFAHELSRSRHAIELSPELWEWCSNWADDEAIAFGDGASAGAVAAGLRKVVLTPSASNGVAARGRLFPRFWYRNVGFRVVIR